VFDRFSALRDAESRRMAAFKSFLIGKQAEGLFKIHKNSFKLIILSPMPSPARLNQPWGTSRA